VQGRSEISILAILTCGNMAGSLLEAKEDTTLAASSALVHATNWSTPVAVTYVWPPPSSEKTPKRN